MGKIGMDLERPVANSITSGRVLTWLDSDDAGDDEQGVF